VRQIAGIKVFINYRRHLEVCDSVSQRKTRKSVDDRQGRKSVLRIGKGWVVARSAGARAEGRARCERARAHAEARAERRRNIAEEVAAAGAAAVVGDGAGGIGAEPVPAQVAQWINALHGETGQILHAHSLSGPASSAGARYGASGRSSLGRPGQNCWRGFCRDEPVVSREMTTRDCGGVAWAVFRRMRERTAGRCMDTGIG